MKLSNFSRIYLSHFSKNVFNHVKCYFSSSSSVFRIFLRDALFNIILSASFNLPKVLNESLHVPKKKPWKIKRFFCDIFVFNSKVFHIITVSIKISIYEICIFSTNLSIYRNSSRARNVSFPQSCC